MAVVVAQCTSRAEADLLVEVLEAAGVRAVAFADVERTPDGHVMREWADVRVANDEVARAKAALDAWGEARREGLDDDELERQALAAGAGEAGPDVARDDPGPEDGGRRGDARARRADDAAATPADGCPYCGAAVKAPWSGAIGRAFAALRGRAVADGAERLCTACGHRWRPGKPAPRH